MTVLVPPTLSEALRQLKRPDGAGFASVRPDGTEPGYTFKEIHSLAEEAAAPAHAGVQKGDRVCIAVPDPDEFVLSFPKRRDGRYRAEPDSAAVCPNIEGYHDTVAHIANASRPL